MKSNKFLLKEKLKLPPEEIENLKVYSITRHLGPVVFVNNSSSEQGVIWEDGGGRSSKEKFAVIWTFHYLQRVLHFF